MPSQAISKAAKARAEAMRNKKKKKPLNWRDLPTNEWPDSTEKRKSHDRDRFKIEAKLRGEEAEAHFRKKKKKKK